MAHLVCCVGSGLAAFLATMCTACASIITAAKRAPVLFIKPLCVIWSHLAVFLAKVTYDFCTITCQVFHGLQAALESSKMSKARASMREMTAALERLTDERDGLVARLKVWRQQAAVCSPQYCRTGCEEQE